MAVTDRFKLGLIAIIRSVMGNELVGPRIDYLAAYPCVAVAQNSDGTLELVPDDKRLPGLSKVPIRYGVPGISATIAGGARVLLEFAGGDPGKPVATVWESASVTVLTVSASMIKLGGSGATQALVLGTSYATHMTTMATALQALQTAITPLMLPPAAAAAKAAALAAFNAATQLAADISAQNTTL